jgi:hypothetical protein
MQCGSGACPSVRLVAGDIRVVPALAIPVRGHLNQRSREVKQPSELQPHAAQPRGPRVTAARTTPTVPASQDSEPRATGSEDAAIYISPNGRGLRRRRRESRHRIIASRICSGPTCHLQKVLPSIASASSKAGRSGPQSGAVNDRLRLVSIARRDH